MPLMRYPGAKTRLTKQLLPHFPKAKSVDAFAEAFVGAGSVFEAFAAGMPDDSEVFLCDADPDIAALWRVVQSGPGELFERVEKFKPSVEAFYEFREQDGEDAPDVERAIRKIALHQISFSGLGAKAGGPIGGADQKSRYSVDCRWSPKTIRRNLSKLNALMSRHRVTVHHGDFEDAIRWAAERAPESTFVYADPPYYEKGGECYVHGLGEEDHDRLASGLRGLKCHWRLSYDNAPRVRDLYAGCDFQPLDVKYSMSSGRAVDDLVIGDKEDVLIAPSGSIGDGILKSNGRMSRAFVEGLRKGPAYIKQSESALDALISARAWQEYEIDGVPYRNRTILEYIARPYPVGPGKTVDELRTLLGDSALAKLEAEIARTRADWVPNPNGLGGRSGKTSEGIVSLHNVQDNKQPGESATPPAPTGNSRAATIRRLRKERPDLLARVESGELTCHAAARDAGFRARVIQVPLVAEKVGRRLVKEGPEFVAEAVFAMGEDVARAVVGRVMEMLDSPAAGRARGNGAATPPSGRTAMQDDRRRGAF